MCNDLNLNASVSVGKENLKSTNLFSDIKFIPCGSVEIQSLYRKTKAKLAATFRFEKRITMYSINDEEVGYCGVLPFKEYKKLILEDTGAIKPVFEDNIRDYLGPNQDVNESICQTILSGDVNAFSMLNNGVTIIATKDENLKNEITKATNSQTAIKKEQLEALSTFQKNLEEFYKTFTTQESLVYERRTGQYRNSDIPQNRIISTQIKTIAAMFLDEPSAVSGQYGAVVKRFGNKIFKSSDKPIIYYTSALALYKIENLFKTNKIDKKYRRSRYHAMMLFRIVVSKEEKPRFNQRKMELYCQNILDVLNNDYKCEKIFKGIVDFIISKGQDIDIENRKCFESKETTEYLLSQKGSLIEYLKTDNVIS